eukprot:COSAG01_NODE_38020_length_481_cov_1.590909_2_plen_56_part_01
MLVTALLLTMPASRPITLMDRHGKVSVQSPSPGNLILVPDRHVGVGTASPQELLDV